MTQIDLEKLEKVVKILENGGVVPIPEAEILIPASRAYLTHQTTGDVPQPRAPVKADIDEEYNSFWKPLVEKDGQIDMEQVKKELHDFSFIMTQVSRVYCHITGSRMSYNTYYADDVIREADAYYEELYSEQDDDENDGENKVQHPDNAAVDKFADAMKEKLANKRAEGRRGWETCSEDVLNSLLQGHLLKGDPLDVGNFAMMLWNNGQKTTAPQPPETNSEQNEDAWTGLFDKNGRKINDGDIVWWDDNSKGKWSRIARVHWKKPDLTFKVIDSPFSGIIGHSFNYGNFIWKATEKYLEVVDSVEAAFVHIRKLRDSGE